MPTLTVERTPTLRLTPLTIDPPLPADPALRSGIDDLIARTKLTFTNVAAETEPVGQSGLEVAVRNFMSTRRPEARETYRSKARTLLLAPVEMRTAEFGRYASASTTRLQQSGVTDLKSFGAFHIDPSALRLADKNEPELWQGLGAALRTYEAQKAAAEDIAAGAAYKHLQLTIHHVHCYAETSELGADEIALGGIVTFPNGDSTVVNEFMVSSDFNEGDTVDVGKIFANWTIDAGPAWPHVYSALIAMAEKDDGGFWQFLHDLWNEVAPQVKELISTGAGAAIGGALGGLWGAVIGAVVGAIIGFIINTFDNADDIIGQKTFVMSLGAATKSYYDWAQLTSGNGLYYNVNYYGDDGHYSMNGRFRVAA